MVVARGGCFDRSGFNFSNALFLLAMVARTPARTTGASAHSFRWRNYPTNRDARDGGAVGSRSQFLTNARHWGVLRQIGGCSCDFLWELQSSDGTLSRADRKRRNTT